MKASRTHSSTTILAIAAAVAFAAIQTLSCNPAADLSARLMGEFFGATLFYGIVFWLIIHIVLKAFRLWPIVDRAMEEEEVR